MRRRGNGGTERVGDSPRVTQLILAELDFLPWVEAGVVGQSPSPRVARDWDPCSPAGC